MSGMGIWGIVKIVATRIPWGKVVENVPAVVDLVERAKGRFKVSSPNDLEERLRLIQEENVKLERTLLETAAHLQQLTNSVKVLSARQRTWSIATAVSLLIAISSLVLWVVK
jgi:hypothetical protein